MAETDPLRQIASRLVALAQEVEGQAWERESGSLAGDGSATVEKAYADRRLRDRLFGDAVPTSPAWDMLLFLTIQRIAKRRVIMTELVEATSVPYTTAMRQIVALEKAGLIYREPSESDRRRVIIQIAPKALKLVEAYFKGINS